MLAIKKGNIMSFEEYWTGKNIDVDTLWHDFEKGKGYIDKVSHSELYLLRLTFGAHPRNLPLFDHELIYKTIKVTFHDAKAEFLTPEEYNEAVPIFLYRVDRGSGIYEFLAEIKPLLTYVTLFGTILGGYLGYLSKEQSLYQGRLEILTKYFPHAPARDKAEFLRTRLPWRREDILSKLTGEGYLEKMEISKNPVTGKNYPEKEETIDVVKALQSEKSENNG